MRLLPSTDRARANTPTCLDTVSPAAQSPAPARTDATDPRTATTPLGFPLVHRPSRSAFRPDSAATDAHAFLERLQYPPAGVSTMAASCRHPLRPMPTQAIPAQLPFIPCPPSNLQLPIRHPAKQLLGLPANPLPCSFCPSLTRTSRRMSRCTPWRAVPLLSPSRHECLPAMTNHAAPSLSRISGI